MPSKTIPPNHGGQPQSPKTLVRESRACHPRACLSLPEEKVPEPRRADLLGF